MDASPIGFVERVAALAGPEPDIVATASNPAQPASASLRVSRFSVGSVEFMLNLSI
jgi:hypothetical protein